MIYGDCTYQKLTHDMDTGEEIIELLAEIHKGEKIYMNKIFDSDPATLRKMAQNLHNMREVFKNGVTDLMDDLHDEDISDIDRAFIMTLRDHYLFWEDKIMEFIKNAQKAVEEVDHEHSCKTKALNDHIEDYVPMRKKPDKTILTYINAEKRLLSLREEDEARMVRLRINDREQELQKKLMDERTLTIKQKKERIISHFEAERKKFLNIIQSEWDKIILKKHNEFDRLLVKYNKVNRVKENVHHKEDWRTEHLKRVK